MKGLGWKDDEILYLRRNWKKVDQDILMNHLGRSFKSIALKAQKMGLPGPYFRRDKKAEPPYLNGVIWRKTALKNYLVSEAGDVWNTKRAVMSSTTYRNKVAVVQIMINKQRHVITVARLVYESFKGQIPEGYVVTHRDGNGRNNDLGNLVLVKRKVLSQRIRSARLCKRVVVYENGKPVRAYKSAKDYASKHYIGYRSLIAYLNGEVEKSYTVQEDVRYAK